MKHLLPLFPLLGLLASCSTNPWQPASIEGDILVADHGITVIETNVDAAFLAGKITKQQAQAVSMIAHQINPLLDSARAAVIAKDQSGATRTMQLVNALLGGLVAYVPTSTPGK